MLATRAPGLLELSDALKAKFGARLVSLEFAGGIKIGAVDKWDAILSDCHPYAHEEKALTLKELKALEGAAGSPAKQKRPRARRR